MKTAAMLLALCASLNAQDAALEGVTVDSSTGRPIAGVHVRVFTLGANMAAKSYGAISDRAGRFSMAKIPPGSYFCMGERAGYLTVGKGGGIPFPSVVIKSGERVADFKLEMTPRASISGRVLDEYGDPVQNARVQVSPASPDAPIAFTFAGNSGTTDDRGEYKLPVGPGKYRVRASVSQLPAGRVPEIRTDGTSAPEYAPTDYASAVEVAAGAEIHGIDIQLGRKSAGSGGIDGTVTGLPDARGFANVHLVSRDSERGYSMQQMTQTAGEGRFSFRDLQPGRHRLFARYVLDGKTLVSQTVEFTDASPPSGVVLRLAPAPDVSGSVVFDGGSPPDAKRTVTLRPVDNGPMTTAPSVELDGSLGFRLTGVFPGRYRVAVQPLPENAYVRGLELDGAAVVPEDLEFSGGGRLKITIGRNAAQIAGRVLDPDGNRLQNTYAGVILIRDLDKIDATGEENVSMVGADASYSFKGVRPGKYWLLAIDAIRTGSVSSPAQLRKYAALAEPVEVKEGDRLRKDLKIATKEALDAKEK